MTTALDRFHAALAAGDVAAMKACFTSDARIWHGFDGMAQTVDEAAAAWTTLFAHSRARTLADVRCRVVDGGLVQQHLFVLTLADGTRKAWPACLVVRLEGDRIARLDEYIDRAGSFVPGDDPLTTPGFQASPQ